jgi:5'-nucleotidase (lipoprotein e(P4) family)
VILRGVRAGSNTKPPFASSVFALLILTLVISGCATPAQEHQVNAVVYKQTGAEARALYYQAFNIARLRLDAILGTVQEGGRPLAVVVDIDETVLDNSPYQVAQIRSGTGYTPQSWKAWSDKSAAKATPGSVEFLQYAQSKHVHVLYITNRQVDELEATLQNLRSLGFPWVDQDHFFPQGMNDSASKQSRRVEAAKNYEIAILIGDNLTDFSHEFEVTGIGPRADAVDRAKALFGDRYIILPNPMYGDWETLGVYDGRTGLTASEKAILRNSVLHEEP